MMTVKLKTRTSYLGVKCIRAELYIYIDTEREYYTIHNARNERYESRRSYLWPPIVKCMAETILLSISNPLAFFPLDARCVCPEEGAELIHRAVVICTALFCEICK